MSGTHPQIMDSGINKETEEIFVKWFTDIIGLVNVTVVATNTMTGREYRKVVEWNKNETTIAISNPNDTFSVIIIAFDHCQNFISNATLVSRRVESESEFEPNSMHCSTPTTSPCADNVRNEGICSLFALILYQTYSFSDRILITMGVLLGIAVVIIIILVIVLLGYLYRNFGGGASKL